MFAFAFWDARERRLQLARDRFGIKPLYYHRWPSGIAFGSEIKALLPCGRISRRIDFAALHEYLWYGNALGERTLYADVRELPPAHCLTLSRSGAELEAWWSLEDVEPSHETLAEAEARLRADLDAAVRRHLVSDVPVGVFLSGGIDSSTLTAIASRHYAGRLKTYSVGFDFDKGVNELAAARRVAEHFGCDHHELHVAGGDLGSLLETLVRCHDEPFADAANLPLYLLCRELHGAVKVVLQGDGGDEMFAGYRRYRMLQMRSAWRAAALATAPFAGLLERHPLSRRFARMAAAAGRGASAERMALLLTTETLREPPARILAPELRAETARHDPFARYRELDARFASLEPVQRMLYVDASVILPDTFLEKVDKSTMAHGVEVRVPLLDAELARTALSLPAKWKARTREGKWILKRALRGIVPDEVLDRPKTGFGVPFSWWLRAPLAPFLQSVLFDDATRRAGLFDEAALRVCVDEHVSGRADRGFLLYKALILALWHRAYVSADAAASA
jgi:asparagine synthase (glutamine-hydrolysing)